MSALQDVLCATRDEHLRKNLNTAVQQLGWPTTVTVSETLGGVMPSQGRKADAFIVDCGLSTHKEVAKVVQKLRQLSRGNGAVLMLATRNNTPEILALASDYDVERIINMDLLSVLNGLKKGGDARKRLAEEGQWGQRIESLRIARKPMDGVVREFFSACPKSISAQIEMGNLLLQEMDVTSAIAIADKGLKESPGNLRFLNLQARILLKKNMLEEGLQILERAHIMSPANIERLILLGETFRHKSQNSKARDSYMEALELSPGNREAQVGLGQVNLDEGRINEALALFRDAATEEEIGGFFNNAAIMAARRGDVGAAIRLYTSAIQAVTTPKLQAKVVFNMGVCHKRHQHLDEARQAFGKALQLDPMHEKAKLQLNELNSGETPKVVSAPPRPAPAPVKNTPPPVSQPPPSAPSRPSESDTLRTLRRVGTQTTDTPVSPFSPRHIAPEPSPPPARGKSGNMTLPTGKAITPTASAPKKVLPPPPAFLDDEEFD